MYIVNLKISHRRKIADETFEISLETVGTGFSYEPGQYMRVTLPELLFEDQKNYRDFAISSSPGNEDVITFAFRPSESGFKRTLQALPLGSTVTVSGPHGNLMLPQNTAHPLVFIAGGIGIASFVGKIRWAASRDLPYRMHLVWGERNRDRAAYVEELERIAPGKNFAFQFTPVFGETIDRDLITSLIPDPERRLWQIAGPPHMVDAMRTMLTDMSVEPDMIAAEVYGPLSGNYLLPTVEKETDAKRLHALHEALNRTAIVSETDSEGTIEFVNDKFVEVSGYRREELIGQNHRILKSGHHSPEFYQDLWQKISGGRVWRGEIKNRAKDGSYYWVDTCIVPIMNGGKTPVNYVSVRFVITERKEAEEELYQYRRNLEEMVQGRTGALKEANEELQAEIEIRKELERKLEARAATLAEADRQKNKFLTILSHELRNPMTPILNSVQIMKLLRVNDPNMIEAVEVIERQTQQMALLLQELLDISRIDRGKIELTREPVELHELIRRSVETSKPLIDRWQHTLTITVPDEEVWFEADALRLQQVVVNLLNNSAKYTEAGGSIALEAGHREDNIEIRISDSGIGIAPDMLVRVFDLFAQSDHPWTRSRGGLGVGLHLAQALAQLHGGDVSAHSPGVGKGSTFTVRIPLHRVVPKRPEPIAKKQVAVRRILVVDDVVDLAKSLGSLFQGLGHDVRIATSGQEAMNTVETFKPEFVFLDLGMPVMDGFETIRRLKDVPNTAGATFIALTGFGKEEDRQRCLAAGFSRHVVKPPSLEILENILAENS